MKLKKRYQRCPKCKVQESDVLATVELQDNEEFRLWICYSCGHSWTDTAKRKVFSDKRK